MPRKKTPEPPLNAETDLIGFLTLDQRRNLESRGIIVERLDSVLEEYSVKLNTSLFLALVAIDTAPLSLFFPSSARAVKSAAQRKQLYGAAKKGL
jgi:hypothetical protein